MDNMETNLDIDAEKKILGTSIIQDPFNFDQQRKNMLEQMGALQNTNIVPNIVKAAPPPEVEPYKSKISELPPPVQQPNTSKENLSEPDKQIKAVKDFMFDKIQDIMPAVVNTTPTISNIQSNKESNSVVDTEKIKNNLENVNILQNNSKVSDQFKQNILKMITDIGESMQELDERTTRPEPKDPFEERITLRPTNLIFEDRKIKMSETPYWA